MPADRTILENYQPASANTAIVLTNIASLYESESRAVSHSQAGLFFRRVLQIRIHQNNDKLLPSSVLRFPKLMKWVDVKDFDRSEPQLDADSLSLPRIGAAILKSSRENMHTRDSTHRTSKVVAGGKTTVLKEYATGNLAGHERLQARMLGYEALPKYAFQSPRAIEFDKATGVSWLQMDFFDKGSLRQHLPRSKKPARAPRPIAAALKAKLLQVVMAVGQLHSSDASDDSDETSAPRVHRNLKPENVFEATDGRMVISIPDMEWDIQPVSEIAKPAAEPESVAEPASQLRPESAPEPALESKPEATPATAESREATDWLRSEHGVGEAGAAAIQAIYKAQGMLYTRPALVGVRQQSAAHCVPPSPATSPLVRQAGHSTAEPCHCPSLSFHCLSLNTTAPCVKRVSLVAVGRLRDADQDRREGGQCHEGCRQGGGLAADLDRLQGT